MKPCADCAPLFYDTGQVDRSKAPERADDALAVALEELTEYLGSYEAAFSKVQEMLWAYRPEFVRPLRRPISARMRRRVLERDEFVCVECGATDGLQVDHAVPVSRGGPNAIENLRTLCAPCNLEKKDR